MAGAVLASLPTPWRIPARGIAAVALGLAIFAAVVARVGTPRGPIVAFNPEFAWPSDGRLVDVDARFNYCMICATDMVIELVDVQLRHPDGSITPALGTDSVMVRNADGTELLLRARIGDPAENPDERWQEWMWYAISYALTDGEGRRQVVEDRVVFPLQSAQYGPRFWTGEIEGTERR
jgi:hypothetical protein